MQIFKAALVFLMFLVATEANARYYDPAKDGACYTLDQMRKKAHASYLKYYPKEGGGRCWYRPGRPEIKVAKGVMPHGSAVRPSKNDKIEAVAVAPAAADIREFVAKAEREPASFSQRFDAFYVHWYDLISPYASQRGRLTTVALAVHQRQ